MNIKPLNDRILVLRIEGEQKTSGGIIIPDTAKEKPLEGKIIAAGPGKVDDKGKRIVEHLIMREDDILGIIEG